MKDRDQIAYLEAGLLRLGDEVEDYRRATAIHRQRTFKVVESPMGVEYKMGWRAATDSMARAILEAQAERQGEDGVLDEEAY